MLKYLVVIGVIAFVYFFFIKKKPLKNTTTTSKEEKLQSNDLVECSSCGVYSEVSESILSNGKYYCSKECLERG